MKKLLILAALLTVGAGAFAQAKAGSLGVVGLVAYNQSSIGLDYYLLSSLSMELSGNYRLGSNTSEVVKNIPSTSEQTYTSNGFGLGAGLYFRLPMVDNLDIGIGPGGYWSSSTSGVAYEVTKSTTVAGRTISYASTRSVYTDYGANLGAQLKYFVTPKVAIFTKVAGGFGTSLTQNHYLNAADESVVEIDESTYSFYTTTPALGVVFYLN